MRQEAFINVLLNVLERLNISELLTSSEHSNPLMVATINLIELF